MKGKIILVSSVALAAFFVFLFMTLKVPKTGSLSNEQTAVLTQEQVNALRAAYPLHSGVPSFATMKMPSLQDIIDRADTLLYAKVLGKIDPYEIEFSAGALQRKDSFFGYDLEVIRDSAGKLKKGANVTVSANAVIKELYPSLRKGMEIIIPISKSSFKGKQYDFSSLGMFYVTDGGYAISAYNMEDAIAKDGTHVSLLLKTLWGMKKK
ncbi:MAG: hypothetical protein LBH95_04765 [Oscillospiraceae bacterium]|jgi:hypothetical protein|nr:hypothetical protein [Oscillospiraceae bacterium]